MFPLDPRRLPRPASHRPRQPQRPALPQGHHLRWATAAVAGLAVLLAATPAAFAASGGTAGAGGTSTSTSPSPTPSASPSASASPSSSGSETPQTTSSSPSPSASPTSSASPQAASSSPSPSPSPSPSEPTSVNGFVPLSPTRIVDTRIGLGAPASPVPAGSVLQVQVAGNAGGDGVPTGIAIAVVFTVTVVDPTTLGYLTVYPDTGNPPPDTSSVNFTPGQTVANTVVSQLSGGQISIFDGQMSGQTDILVDVDGYYTPGPQGAFVPVTPSQRLLDTRTTNSITAGPLAGGQTITLPVAGQAGVPSSGVLGADLVVTALGNTEPGYLTVSPAGAAVPTTSNLNLAPGGIPVANSVQVGLGDGAVSIHNGSPSPVEVVVDLEGYFVSDTAGGSYTPLPPTRVLDTRGEIGGPTGAVPADGNVGTTLSCLPAGSTAAVINLTVTEPTGFGYLNTFATGGQVPVTSVLDFTPGATVADAGIAPLSSTQGLSVHNGSPDGSAQVIVDLLGFFSPPGEHPSGSCAPTPPANSAQDAAAPDWTASQYAADLTTSASQDFQIAAGHGCTRAQAGTPGLVVIDFGAQGLSGGTWGVWGYSQDANFLTDAEVVAAAEGFLSGYVGCLDGASRQLIEALGTNNSGAPSQEGSQAGAIWAGVVNTVAAYAQSQGFTAQGVRVGGADDIEPGFNPPASALAWVQGWQGATNHDYYDYGSADGCPGVDAGTTTCGNGWTLGQLWQVSAGVPDARAVPEIYTPAGDYVTQGDQWAAISSWGVSAGQPPIAFAGEMTQYGACAQQGGCAGTDNTPAQGWDELWSALHAWPQTAISALPFSTDIMWDFPSS